MKSFFLNFEKLISIQLILNGTTNTNKKTTITCLTYNPNHFKKSFSCILYNFVNPIMENYLLGTPYTARILNASNYFGEYPGPKSHEISHINIFLKASLIRKFLYAFGDKISTYLAIIRSAHLIFSKSKGFKWIFLLHLYY